MATIAPSWWSPGGAARPAGDRRRPPAADCIVAAAGGLDHARAAGLVPDVLVGDLDSVSADGLGWATANIAIQRHRPTRRRLTPNWPRLRRAMDRNASILVAGTATSRSRLAALGASAAATLGGGADCRGAVGHRPRRRRSSWAAGDANGPGTTFSLLASADDVPRRDGQRRRWPSPKRPRPAGPNRRV